VHDAQLAVFLTRIDLTNEQLARKTG
jgi:hypothetical protein